MMREEEGDPTLKNDMIENEAPYFVDGRTPSNHAGWPLWLVGRDHGPTRNRIVDVFDNVSGGGE